MLAVPCVGLDPGAGILLVLLLLLLLLLLLPLLWLLPLMFDIDDATPEAEPPDKKFDADAVVDAAPEEGTGEGEGNTV